MPGVGSTLCTGGYRAFGCGGHGSAAELGAEGARPEGVRVRGVHTRSELSHLEFLLQRLKQAWSPAKHSEGLLAGIAPYLGRGPVGLDEESASTVLTGPDARRHATLYVVVVVDDQGSGSGTGVEGGGCMSVCICHM